jgi:ACS family glucarate transporter-like MFS transporter
MARPTLVRYSVVGLAMAVNMLCYTDRVCIAVAGPKIRSDLGLSQAQLGLVFSIFFLAYASAQAPWGMLADRFGSRDIVTAAIFCWSGFTALTGAVWGFVSMLAVRFTFGTLEAALSPATATAFTRWVPVAERSTCFGAYLSGGRLGAALTPPIAAFLMQRFGWRTMFAIFGSLGVLAAAAWFAWFRDDPAAHAAVNAEEREIIREGIDQPSQRSRPASYPPWAELLRSSRLWCLLGVAFASTFLWQFYITWFPTYLIEKRGLPVQEASYYAGLPFLCGFVATWVGGMITDYLTRRFDARRGRLYLGCAGLLLTGSLMLVGVVSPQPRAGALLMAVAAGTIDLYLGAAWSSAVDIGGRSGGAVAGLMNASSNCAGFASPALMGWVLQTTNNWNTVLFAGIVSTFVAAYFWTQVNAPVAPRRLPGVPVCNAHAE